jgi:hypothetical protein
MTVRGKVDVWVAEADRRNQTKIEADNRHSHAALRRILPWTIGINAGLVLCALLSHQLLLAVIGLVVVVFLVGVRRVPDLRS